MVALVASRALTIKGRNNRASSPVVTLAPKTAEIGVRILTPTPSQGVDMAAQSRFRVVLVVVINGEEYRATCEGTGGQTWSERAQAWRSEIGFRWQLPMGFFGEGEQVNPSRWPELKARRWGETAKGPVRSWYEIERIEGDVDSTIVFEGTEADAPQDWKFHHSIAYDSQTSATESGGDGVVSVSYTASAGSDRIAVVSSTSNKDNAVTSIAHTYGGASPSLTRAMATIGANTWQSTCSDLFNDSEIGSGAKTAQATHTGGSGTLNATMISVLSMSGVDQTTPSGGAATSQANSGNVSATATSVGSTDLVVDAWGKWDGTYTAGADQTQRVHVSDGSVRLFNSTQPGTAGGVMSWTAGAGNGGEYAGGAFALKEAAAGGGGLSIPVAMAQYRQRWR